MTVRTEFFHLVITGDQKRIHRDITVIHVRKRNDCCHLIRLIAITAIRICQLFIGHMIRIKILTIFLFCVIHMQNGKDDLIVFQPVLVKFSVYDILLKLCQRVFIIPIQD